MAKTKRSEQKGFVQKSAPASGTKVVAYAISPSDGFMQNVLTTKVLDDALGSFQGTNDIPTDEYYRTTRIKTESVTGAGVQIRRTTLSLARQIATKKDQEAVIRVVTTDKIYKADQSKGAKKVNPLKQVIPPFTKFFLESVTENRMEKAQVIETFGEFVAFFFGSRPEVYQFSGRLLNTKDHDWKNDFQENYENFLRGTKAVENDSTVFIQYDDVLAEGFLMNCHLEYHGVTNNECPFNFSMLVINRAPINQIARLRERKARGRFSAAEQQLLNSLTRLRSADNKTPFVIMQGALSPAGLPTADTAVVNNQTNKLTSSDKDDPQLSSSGGGLASEAQKDKIRTAKEIEEAKNNTTLDEGDSSTQLSEASEAPLDEETESLIGGGS